MKRRSAGLAAVLSLVVTAGVLVPTATPAHATIFADIGAVADIVAKVKSSYTAVIDFITDPGHPQTDVEQIKSAVAASTETITHQIDAVAAAEVKAKCDRVGLDFLEIDHKSPAQLEDLRGETLTCLTEAANQIHVAVSPAALDGDVLALNFGGPLALAASVRAGDRTDVIVELLNAANRELLTRQELKPKCGFTPDVDVEATTYAQTGTIPGTGGEAPVPGHGACYSYQVTAPQLTQGDVLYYPTGPGTGHLPWPVVGDGQEEFCGGVFTCGRAKVNWPPSATTDFSAAAEQAMAATGWPIARAALDLLGPLPGAVGQPLSVTSETTDIYSPIDVFGVTSTGGMVRGTLTDTSHDDETNGVFAHDTFLGWTDFGRPAFVSGSGGPGPTLESVASALTWDGRVQVFVLDRQGNLFTRWQLAVKDDAHWSPWAHLDGELTSVTVARNHDKRLQLFGTTRTGQVVTRYQVLNTVSEFAGPYVPIPTSSIHPAVDAWEAWQTMAVPGGMTQVAATTQGNEIWLFGLTGNASIYRTQQTKLDAADTRVAGNWAGWTAVAAPVVGGSAVPVRAIGAFTDFGNGVNLLVTAFGGQQYQQVGPSVWQQIPGSMLGGYGAGKEGGGAGADEMFGVDAAGAVYYTFSGGVSTFEQNAWHPEPWHAWLPVGGATLRSYTAGPGVGPVLHSDLSWTDMSSNEDAFAVFRYATGGQYVSEAADLPSADKAGTGRKVTFTDPSPNAAAPCYAVFAYDYNGAFEGASDVVCPLPSLVGTNQTAATTSLTNAGFLLGQVTPVNDCVNPGIVRVQSPAGGRAAQRSQVNLTVGTCTSVVPKAVGLTQAAASNALTAVTLKLGAVTTVNTCDAPGTVRSQFPFPGNVVPKNSGVDLQLNSCVVPNVLGRTQADAAAVLGGSGLWFSSVSSTNTCSNPGTVQTQNPAAGTSLSQAGGIAVTVSSCVVPDVVSDSPASARATLTGLGLKVSQTSVTDCTDPGTVRSTSPSSGTAVAPGSTVTIRVGTCTGGHEPN